MDEVRQELHILSLICPALIFLISFLSVLLRRQWIEVHSAPTAQAQYTQIYLDS